MFLQSANPLKSGHVGYFLTAFLILWCGITFCVDAQHAHDTLRQTGSRTYDRVEGTVLKCEILRESDGDGGTSFSLAVSYSYVVDGQVHTGTRYRYGSTSFDLSMLRRVEAELPAGRPVTVYHSPGQPDDAVLAPGLIGYDLYAWTMMVPFNVVAVAGLAAIARRNRPRFDGADPRMIAPTESGWRFHPYGRAWWGVFGTTILAISFASIFVIGFAFGTNPSLTGMLGFWAAMLAVSTIVATRYRGWWALEYDRFRHTLTVRGQESVTIPVGEITHVSVDEEVKTDSDGDKTTHYYLKVTWGADDRPTRVHKFPDRPTAELAANWLKESLALKPRVT